MRLDIQVLAFNVQKTLAQKTNGFVKLCSGCGLQFAEKLSSPGMNMPGKKLAFLRFVNIIGPESAGTCIRTMKRYDPRDLFRSRQVLCRVNVNHRASHSKASP